MVCPPAVLVKLHVESPGDIDYTIREVNLSQSKPTLQIGRSSTRPNVDLHPAVDNGWFNSPVMSRHHAEITADFSNKASMNACPSLPSPSPSCNDGGKH